MVEKSDQEVEKILTDIGLDKKIIEGVIKNKKLKQSLMFILDAVKVTACPKKKGNLFYTTATLDSAYEQHFEFMAKYIQTDKIASSKQLELALNYIKKHNIKGQALNVQEFEKECGVGVNYTEADIIKEINNFFNKNIEELKKMRYIVKMQYRREIGELMTFADGAIVTKQFNALFEKILGPETEDDKKMIQEHNKNIREQQKQKEKEKEKQLAKPVNEKQGENQQNVQEVAPKFDLSDLIARDLSSTVNTAKHLEEAKKQTGGRLFTRFPPEPNGYLHIGHAKAMRFSFVVARDYKGCCNLRFDDTNPEKETQEFIQNIKENVNWLGYTPYQVLHASDYFQKIYEHAVTLIKKGLAYVCHQTKAEMSQCRKELTGSPFRNRTIEENLKLFDGMKKGLFEEGECCLKAKIDFAHPNPTMRDPVIYRIKYKSHPHLGNKWCIYPCYDFTHCISDSIEFITYSLCTLEFEIRRDLYYWVLENLDLYKPYQYEYSRLNISNTVLSKRKLVELIEKKYVSGWDDPRMPTVIGLRRRGYTAEAINNFVDNLGVTRRGNEMMVSIKMLEHFLRQDLDAKSPRCLTVVDPVKVTLVNVNEDFCQTIDAPFFPKEEAKGKYKINLKKHLFVDKEDVKAVDNPKFFGFAPGKVVGLKYAGIVKVVDVVVNDKQDVIEVKVEQLNDTNVKPKAFVHWIAANDSIPCEVRNYENLFSEEDPLSLPNYLDGINPHSLATFSQSRAHKNLLNSKVGDRFQFERLGYYVIDKESNLESQKLVFNRTVTLKEGEKVKAIKEDH